MGLDARTAQRAPRWPRLPSRHIAALALASLLLFAVPALARKNLVVIPQEDRAALATEIRSLMASYDSVTTFPLPVLEDQRMKELFDGDVVRFRDKWQLKGADGDDKERHRVLAFRLVNAPRQTAWISAMDSHFSLNDRITEVRMAGDDSGASRWYQFMDLPWPVSNRHWIIRLEKGLDVCAKTNGRVWEQSWHLVPNGQADAVALAEAGKTGDLSVGHVKGARYLDANDGAWALFALNDNLTLIAYNLTITLGGLIPEGMAAKFAMGALEELLDRIAANTSLVASHYVGAHEPIYAGDGTAIPTGQAPANAASAPSQGSSP